MISVKYICSGYHRNRLVHGYWLVGGDDAAAPNKSDNNTYAHFFIAVQDNSCVSPSTTCDDKPTDVDDSAEDDCEATAAAAAARARAVTVVSQCQAYAAVTALTMTQEDRDAIRRLFRTSLTTADPETLGFLASKRDAKDEFRTYFNTLLPLLERMHLVAFVLGCSAVAPPDDEDSATRATAAAVSPFSSQRNASAVSIFVMFPHFEGNLAGAGDAIADSGDDDENDDESANCESDEEDLVVTNIEAKTWDPKNSRVVAVVRDESPRKKQAKQQSVAQRQHIIEFNKDKEQHVQRSTTTTKHVRQQEISAIPATGNEGRMRQQPPVQQTGVKSFPASLPFEHNQSSTSSVETARCWDASYL